MISLPAAESASQKRRTLRRAAQCRSRQLGWSTLAVRPVMAASRRQAQRLLRGSYCK